ALDPGNAAARLGYLLEDSAVELIVSQSSVWSQVDWESSGVESGRVRWVAVDGEDGPGGCERADPASQLSATNLACVMFESDRSGEAVGVRGSHVGLLAGVLGRGEESCQDWIASLWAWPSGLLSGAGVDLSALVPKSAETGFAAHYVLDSNAGLLPVGAAGELYVGGAGVAGGYLNRAAPTAARFVPNPFSSEPGGRLYRSGIQARWMSDGTARLLAREEHSGGLRFEAEELRQLERVLLGHAGVKEAVVLSLDGPQERQGRVAYVVESSPGREPVERLIAQLKEYLRSQPKFHAVPHEWVVLESLLRTASGMVDRRALTVPAENACSRRVYEAPSGAREQILAAVWVDLLGVERVGRQDNFFELGGHSLLATGLIERLFQHGLRLDVRSLFERPTLCQLAES